MSVAHRTRGDGAAAVALDGDRHDGASRLRQHVPGTGRGGHRRRRDHPGLSERHARPGTRGRAATPGRAGRFHGLGHRHLGQRRTQAAGPGLPVHVARLGSRAQRRRRAGRTRGRRLSRTGRPHAADRLGRFVRLPSGDHAVARRHRNQPARRPQDPDDTVADLRQGRRADGGEPDANGLWRSLHVAADGRHRRLRARREHDAPAAFL